MAYSDNIIKNMANEITRNCHADNVVVEYDFVVYIIQLMLYNPRFGGREATDRGHLENFVHECVRMIVRSDTRLHTLRMQHTVDTVYDTLGKLMEQHLDSIERCLKPLVNEILDADPEAGDAAMKLYRKISIFVVLASGLGNPGAVVTLKEGMAALASVFPAADLRSLLELPRPARLARLHELVALVSGVRLFNRDCGRGGDGIPDLASSTLEASAACRAALTATLTSVTQRVNTLTVATAAAVTVDADTGKVMVKSVGMSEDCTSLFDLVAFYRQYEVYLRRLLSDVTVIADSSAQGVDSMRAALRDLHLAVRYKTAVPADAVYPLFKKLWSIWRTMQNMMYLLATVHRLMTSLGTIHDHVKVSPALDEMLRGRKVVADQGSCKDPVDSRLGAVTYRNESVGGGSSVQFLGFCAMCLNVGALVPSDGGMGHVTCDGVRYGFCSADMARRFSAAPTRYINETLEFARSNIHVVNLLHLKHELHRVRGIHDLVARVEPRIEVVDRDIQTDTHPVESHIDEGYSWDMWKWKRRACHWASIVNRRTRSTQTLHSHMRRDAPCQTAEPRDRGAQTLSDAAVMTDRTCGLLAVRGRGGESCDAVTGDGGGNDRKKVAVGQIKVCPCTVSVHGDIDNKTYEIIKRMDEILN